MTLFQNLFLKSKAQPVEYNGKVIYLSDLLDVSSDQNALLTFESSDSIWRQGVYMSTDGSFEIAGKIIKNAVVLWQNTAPREVAIRIQTKNGKVRVKNVWDIGNGVMHSCHGGAAMIVEKTESCCRYRCNDGQDDEDFDDLIFSIKVLKLVRPNPSENPRQP